MHMFYPLSYLPSPQLDSNPTLKPGEPPEYARAIGKLSSTDEKRVTDWAGLHQGGSNKLAHLPQEVALVSESHSGNCAKCYIGLEVTSEAGSGAVTPGEAQHLLWTCAKVG